MIKLLKYFLLKNETDLEESEVRNKYGIICGIAGITINIMLFIIKFIAGIVSNSIAISADAFNNLADAGSSVITIIGFKLSNKKPDPGHPFGHGRIEYLSGLIVSMIIILMGFELLISSFQKIFNPEITEFNSIIVLILSISILLKIYIYFYNNKLGKIFNSTVMIATAKDSLCDTFSTIAVLLSAVFTYFTDVNIDAYVGILVSLFIFYSGIQSAIDTMNPLLGQAPSKEFVDEVKKITLEHKYVLGIHDLIVHDYGPGRLMISLHVEVPAKGDILLMHDEIDNIEKDLQKALKCHAVVHMDPIENDNTNVTELKSKVIAIMLDIDENLTIHDFRIVPGPTHTNVLFDVVIPNEFNMGEKELNDKITDEILKINSNYFVIVDFDRNYIKE